MTFRGAVAGCEWSIGLGAHHRSLTELRVRRLGQSVLETGDQCWVGAPGI